MTDISNDNGIQFLWKVMQARINTDEASKWKRLRVMVFGKRVELTHPDGRRAICYRHQGKFYFYQNA